MGHSLVANYGTLCKGAGGNWWLVDLKYQWNNALAKDDEKKFLVKRKCQR